MSQVKVNFQTNDDASFKIEFNDNQRYLNNGEIVFPKNSLGYIVDESELITLVKPSGDPYISFKIDDTQFADLAAFEEWYSENAVGSGIDPDTLSGLVSSAQYVSSSSTINFLNVDGDVISSIDAEPFITDGMVDNVAVSGTNLVITFNVDAGKQPISIPLSSIFNPNNYYGKTEVNALLGGKADWDAVLVDEYGEFGTVQSMFKSASLGISTPITRIGVEARFSSIPCQIRFRGISGELDIIVYPSQERYELFEFNVSDIDTSDVSGFSITYGDNSFIIEVDASNPFTALFSDGASITYYTRYIPEKYAADAIYDNLYPLIDKVEGTESALSGKVDASAFTAYSAATNTALSGKVDTSAFTAYSAATNTALSGKQDTLVAGSGITISGNVISADGGSGGGMSEDDELLLATALVDLNDRKMDASEVKSKYQKKGDYATRTELATKANAADVPTLSDYIDSQNVTSYALNDLNNRFGGMMLMKLTQAEYDALTVKDENTLYIITNVVNNG